MEFIRFSLRAYGPFTNKTLQFQNGNGSPRLHLVLGPNEAGKSTALRGLRAVLFGMDARDAHLHAPDMLRASLKLRAADGQLFDVERRKGKGSKSLLFTDSSKPVPADVWTRVLPVIDPELFENMFGLDYDSLVKGGRQLAEFKGEIGQTILAAAGDMNTTAERIQELRRMADDIYSPQATQRKLNKALRAFRDADAVMRRERFTSAKYREAVGRQSELERDLKEIADGLGKCSEHYSRLTRIQTAAPHVQRFHNDENELANLVDVTLLRPDFEQRFNKAMSVQSRAADRKNDLTAELERLARERGSLRREPELAALLSEVERLNSETGKIKASREDLPKREAALQQLLLDQDKICRNLGLQPSTVPQLTAGQRKRIELLSSQYFGLTTKGLELPGRITGLQSRVRDLDADLAHLPPNVDTSHLSQQLAQIPPKRQSGAETKRLKRNRDELAARLQVELKSLPLWNGTAEQLEVARVPLAATVNEFATKFALQDSQENQLGQDKSRIGFERERCERQLKTLDQQGTIPTEEQLAAARARRDLGWTAVKDQWLNSSVGGSAETSFLSADDAPLPRAFEVSVTAADSVADQLRLEAERVEQKRTALEDCRLVEQRLADHEQTVELAKARREGLENEWISLWSDVGIRPRTPNEMLAWLDKRAKLVEQVRDLRQVAEQVAESQREEQQWREALATALGVSPAQTLSDLISRARQLVESSAAVREKRSNLVTRKRDAATNLQTELQSLQENEKALQEWARLWKAAIKEASINESADPSTIPEVVGLIDSFWNRSDAVKDLGHRIGGMRDDDDKFSGAVRATALQAGRTDIAKLDSLAAVKEMEKLARAAHEKETAADRFEQDRIRTEQGLGEAGASTERANVELDELRREANVADLSLLPDAIERSKRKAVLTEARRSHLQALALSAGNLPVDTFVQQVQNANADTLPSELEDLQERIKVLEVQRAEKTRERDDIERTFRLKEEAVEVTRAACDKNSAVARIDALTSEFLEYQIGATLLEKAMARYRVKHQDPIMKGAGEYFAALTCGAFSGLVIDYEDGARVMKGERTNGQSLGVGEMSDGTRDQLFLALRLAYIDHHCEENEPCPVILDDVLMAFDDERASAALKVLQELSKKTQVLVFTHHAHHVKLAESVLGETGFQLHELAR